MICYFYFVYCLLHLSCSECNVLSLYFLRCSVNGSVCLVGLTMFVNWLVKQFAICLCGVVILLLNVMEMLRVGGVNLLDIPCLVFQRMCVFCLFSQCASRCFFHRFCVCVFVLEVIFLFMSLIAGSQVLLSSSCFLV